MSAVPCYLWPAPTGAPSPEPTGYVPQIGDIFVSSWGYDQTNVDAYYVCDVTASGKSVRTVPANVTTIDRGSGRERVTPTGYPARNYDGVTTGGDLHRILQHSRNSEPSIKVGYQTWAYLWNGTRDYHQTATGWGH